MPKREEKLSPKLRMILNCSTEVNAVRAEHAGSLAVADARAVPLRRAGGTPPIEAAAAAFTKPPKLRGKTADADVSVFVRLVDPAAAADPTTFPGYVSHRGDIVSAVLPLAELGTLAASDLVSYVTPGESLARPNPRISTAGLQGPAPTARPVPEGVGRTPGAGVLIGIVDVQGFDFSHPDFLVGRGADRRTRFHAIWDQAAGGSRPSPYERKRSRTYRYGSELVAEDMNRAIAEADQRGLPAWRLEPQSETVPGSHGTHVASIAAGASGFCPHAKIAAVLVSLPKGDYERRKSFYDSTRVAHAIDYLVAIAEEEGLPLSINISLGTNGHAHDASSAIDRWADHLLSTPGRCISVAAGNAGQTTPVDDDDIGWTMGRIHSSGRIAARRLYTDIEWIVAGNGFADVSENELEIWYSGQDRFGVSIRPPGSPWHRMVGPREYIENAQLPDGSFYSVYNELYHPANGANYISVYLTPNFKPKNRDGVIGVPAGKWTVRLHGLEVRDGRYHAWIERDDPRPQGRVGDREVWSFPSFFSERSMVDESTVSSLACGLRVLSVANLDEAVEQIAVTSSQGPTRDGRNKPDVAAPGTEIVAANGFAGPDEPWVAMTGTSMASPYVAGVAGLMLGVNRKLTAAQIAGIVQSTALPLPDTDFAWRNDSGFGVIDVAACVEEAAKVGDRQEVKP